MSAHAIHAFDDADRHLVGIGALRVLVCEESGEWFAQGVEIDYAATGDSLEDVKLHFEKGLAATIRLHLSRFKGIDRLLRYAPTDVWRRLTPDQAFQLDILTTHDLSEDSYAFNELPFGGILYLKDDAPHHAATAKG